MQKPKIGLLSPYAIYPTDSGGKKFTALFFEYLGKELPVELITVSKNENPENVTKVIHPILGKSRWRYVNISLLFRLQKLIKERNFSHLIISHPYYGWLAFLLAKTTGIKVCVLSHNIEALRFKTMGKWWWKLMRAYEMQTHQLAAQNFFITEEDKIYAVKNYKLSEKKCHVITYGITWNVSPTEQEKENANADLKKRYGLLPNTKLILFNGSLNYLPNEQAVDYILSEINPRLMKSPEQDYIIIICGKGLPERFKNLEAYKDQNIIYAGFVPDIQLYFKGSDIFINPIVSGGGIKTKLVEALGNNIYCVSTTIGASGIPTNVVGNQLKMVDDYDWDAFADSILNDHKENIGPAFFKHFYWGNIAKKAASILKEN